MTEDKNIT